MISCYLWMAINSGVETKPVSWRLVSGNGAEVEGATWLVAAQRTPSGDIQLEHVCNLLHTYHEHFRQPLTI